MKDLEMAISDKHIKAQDFLKEIDSLEEWKRSAILKELKEIKNTSELKTKVNHKDLNQLDSHDFKFQSSDPLFHFTALQTPITKIFEVTKDIQAEMSYQATSSVNITQNIFIIRSGQELNLFEENQSDHFYLKNTLFILEEDAKLNHISVNRSVNGNSHYLALVSKNAQFSSSYFDLGAGTTRQTYETHLNGLNAQAMVNQGAILKDQDRSETYSYFYHNSPVSFSHQLVKSILDDQSRSLFRGRIKIAKGADGVDANQLNKNLLLSAKAHAFSQPQLEIYADDVKCSHGSTTGQLSSNELFYLLSRGIPKKEAFSMLTRGFIEDLVNKADPKNSFSQLKEIIQSRLEDIGV